MRFISCHFFCILHIICRFYLGPEFASRGQVLTNYIQGKGEKRQFTDLFGAPQATYMAPLKECLVDDRDNTTLRWAWLAANDALKGVPVAGFGLGPLDPATIHPTAAQRHGREQRWIISSPRQGETSAHRNARANLTSRARATAQFKNMPWLSPLHRMTKPRGPVDGLRAARLRAARTVKVRATAQSRVERRDRK